jgi:hypothetical protein
MGPDFFVMTEKDRLDIEVSGIKLPSDGFQFAGDLLLRQGKGPPDNGGDPVDVSGNKRADDDARTLREENHLMTSKGDGVHVAKRG